MTWQVLREMASDCAHAKSSPNPRSFVTTDLNKYYDSFIQWQFWTLYSKVLRAVWALRCRQPLQHPAPVPAWLEVLLSCLAAAHSSPFLVAMHYPLLTPAYIMQLPPSKGI